MKITEIHDIGQGYDEYSGKGSLTVTVADETGAKRTVNLRAGEPEDAVFFRDLNGAYDITDLVRFAYEAGLRGEALEYEFIDESEAV